MLKEHTLGQISDTIAAGTQSSVFRSDDKERYEQQKRYIDLTAWQRRVVTDLNTMDPEFNYFMMLGGFFYQLKVYGNMIGVYISSEMNAPWQSIVFVSNDNNETTINTTKRGTSPSSEGTFDEDAIGMSQEQLKNFLEPLAYALLRGVYGVKKSELAK